MKEYIKRKVGARSKDVAPTAIKDINGLNINESNQYTNPLVQDDEAAI